MICGRSARDSGVAVLLARARTARPRVEAAALAPFSTVRSGSPSSGSGPIGEALSFWFGRRRLSAGTAKPSGLAADGISEPGPGRPSIPEETKTLIARMASENGWRARQNPGCLYPLFIRALKQRPARSAMETADAREPDDLGSPDGFASDERPAGESPIDV